MDTELMTIKETAEYVRMTPAALAQLRYLKRGPRYTALTPKKILYRKEWLDSWIAAGEVAAAA